MRVSRIQFQPQWHILAGALVALISMSASAQGNDCLDGLTCKRKFLYPPDGVKTIPLQGDAAFDLEEFVTKGDFVLQTNGYELTLKVARKLSIGGTLTILAFDGPAASATQQADAGPDSKLTFDRGPNSDGPVPCDFCSPSSVQCFACPGRPGGKGGQGSPGEPGKNGKSGGKVTLNLGGTGAFTVSGKIRINLRGQSGGDGGQGGNGGRGGDGEQGGKGYPGADGCRQESQAGGRGGDGGDAGGGGAGGDAGDGGQVVLLLPAGLALVDIRTEVEPGLPGSGGLPGKGGLKGELGLGGRGFGSCQSTLTKFGEPGIPGRPRNDNDKEEMKGRPGKAGRAGNVFIFDKP